MSFAGNSPFNQLIFEEKGDLWNGGGEKRCANVFCSMPVNFQAMCSILSSGKFNHRQQRVRALKNESGISVNLLDCLLNLLGDACR